jgi:hypothetical protein
VSLRRAQCPTRPQRAGRKLAGWAEPGSWGPWQLGALLGFVALLALLAFRAVGG